MNEREQRLRSKLGDSWYDVIEKEFDKEYMQTLSTRIANERAKGKQIFPTTDNLFSAFKLTPYDRVKVVIIGQDPYHSVGRDGKTPIAHGLAFSSQDNAICPPSLRNMFQEVEDDIKFGLYLNDNYNLTYWAEQGVLLLNKVLTVQKGMAGSHKNWGWEQFTTEVVKSLNRHPNRLVWLLWGKDAKEFNEIKLIDNKWHLVLEAAHPAAEEYAAKYGKASAGFYECKHFSKANAQLKAWGYEEIKW